MMKSEVRKHLEVPAAAAASQQHHLKLVRSKSLNYTSRMSSWNYNTATMNMRPKRTFSLPNRENTALPVVHILQPSEHERVDEESRSSSDKESEQNYNNGVKNEAADNQMPETAKERMMADTKNGQVKRKPASGTRRHHVTSQDSLSDPETRTKATVKDIDELYKALQGLVPKPTPANSRKRRGQRSGTDSDTSLEVPGFQRKYNSEIYAGKNRPSKTEDKINDKKKNLDTKAVAGATRAHRHASREASVENRRITEDRRAMSEDCLFVSDEAESTAAPKERVQRVRSLPAYPDESENEQTPKKSRFLLFRRRRRGRRPGAKPKAKKLSWRALLSSISFRNPSATKKPKKKRSKTKVSSDRTKTVIDHTQARLTPTVRRAVTDVGKRSPLIHKAPTPVVRRSVRETSTAPTKLRHEKKRANTGETVRKAPLIVEVNPPTPIVRRATIATVRTPGTQKRHAPEPPRENTASTVALPRGRSNTIETKTDEVQQKLSTWYQNAVKETSSPAVARIRRNKSLESLLTDSEILHPRNVASSDTDSGENLANLRKVRVRKTRARRNRQKERARWQSLPNVKLVSAAVAKHEEKELIKDAAEPEKIREEEPPTEPSPQTTEPSFPKHATSVSPLQAKISLGNSGGDDDESLNAEPMTDFMSIQNDKPSTWLSRQFSKTNASCIRPLKVNLFYSESPSRETVHRSQSFQVPNKLWFTGNPDVVADSSTNNGLAIKARRNSDRRRKRRSMKRLSRLPQQSPFYFPSDPPSALPLPVPDNDSLDKKSTKDVEKDSGIGSPDLSEEKVFGMAIQTGKRKHSDERGHMACESEDSGWASRENYHVSTRVENGVQTDPVSSTKITILPRARLSCDIDIAENHLSEI